MPRIKRSKNELIIRILEICRGDGAGKTKIVCQANLNFYTINPYLDLLTVNGLLEVEAGNHIRYRTTPKGEKALERLREIETYLFLIPPILLIESAIFEVLSSSIASINELLIDGFAVW